MYVTEYRTVSRTKFFCCEASFFTKMLVTPTSGGCRARFSEGGGAGKSVLATRRGSRGDAWGGGAHVVFFGCRSNRFFGELILSLCFFGSGRQHGDMGFAPAISPRRAFTFRMAIERQVDLTRPSRQPQRRRPGVAVLLHELLDACGSV